MKNKQALPSNSKHHHSLTNSDKQLHEYEYENEQDAQMQQQQQQNPQYTEVDGKIMKLGGLDYDLLKQQKMEEEQSKRSFIDMLKIKVGNIVGDVVGRNGGNVQHNKQIKKSKQIENQQKYRGLLKSVNQYHNIHINPNPIFPPAPQKKTQSYLHFNLDELDLRIPTRIQKRMGKCTNQPIFIDISNKFMDEFVAMMKSTRNNSKNNQSGGKAGVGLMRDEGSDDDDDIFGDDGSHSGESEEQQNIKSDKKFDNKVNIQIGKKLNFNLQQDIFKNIKRPKPIGSLDIDINTKTNTNNQQIPSSESKYSFMPKKRKPIINQEQDEGYGQCYYQSGPSLQQLVDLKKQGIQYYGDLKQFKAKERKVNVNREYQMVQRIIQSKKKQGQ